MERGKQHLLFLYVNQSNTSTENLIMNIIEIFPVHTFWQDDEKDVEMREVEVGGEIAWWKLHYRKTDINYQGINYVWYWIACTSIHSYIATCDAIKIMN